MTAIASSQLRSLIERVERLEEEKAAIVDGIKEVYSEAKAHGYDVPTMRRTVTHRKKLRDNRAKLEEAEALFDLYLAALEQPAPQLRAVAAE